jgi:hypothetical protein
MGFHKADGTCELKKGVPGSCYQQSSELFYFTKQRNSGKSNIALGLRDSEKNRASPRGNEAAASTDKQAQEIKLARWRDPKDRLTS